MRVHVLQLGYGDSESPDQRRERVDRLIRRQDGADLIILPELWPTGGFAHRIWRAEAEPLDGPTATTMARAARDLGTVIHLGSFVERSADGSGPQGRGLWNTSMLLGPDGRTLAVYRKIHRYGFGQGEHTLMEAGDAIVTADLPGGGPTVGLATCYDLRFPELFRRLVDRGVELVLLPAAWPASRVAHWRLLGRARAVENQQILVQCNTAGRHANVRMAGHSQVVDADGELLAEAGENEQVLIAEIDLARVRRWRSTFPVLADRRL
jgi:predicted amidohydrolase